MNKYWFFFSYWTDRESEHQVEAIVDRTLLSDGDADNDADYIYRVRWSGFGPDEDTWEPISHLENCQQKLLALKRRKTL